MFNRCGCYFKHMELSQPRFDRNVPVCARIWTKEKDTFGREKKNVRFIFAGIRISKTGGIQCDSVIIYCNHIFDTRKRGRNRKRQ